MGLKKIKFMDTSFRDGLQSVYGSRVRTKDILPVIQAAVEAGIDHFEIGGGERFEAMYRYCQENPFDMMDKIRKAVGGKVKLQSLSRGINLVGNIQQPRDIIQLHANLFKKHGMDVVRNFDALNDVNNLDYSGQCLQQAGLEHQITIAISGTPPTTAERPAHTPEFYLEKLEQILGKSIPFNSIVFKDVSGTTAPQTVFETIKGARERVGNDMTLWFHTHDSAGLGTMCNMAAIRAGADGVDLSLSPVSGGNGQPDLLSAWHALRHTDFTLDIDVKKIYDVQRLFEQAMQKYHMPPESKRTSTEIILMPFPGGELTAFMQQMRADKNYQLIAQLVDELAEVIDKAGFGTCATPISQFYFAQAYTNLLQGRWKIITEQYGNLVLGYYGRPPRKPDQRIVAIAVEQLKKQIFDGNPVDILSPGTDKATKLLTSYKLPETPENVFLAAMGREKAIEFLVGNSKLELYMDEKPKKGTK